MATNFEEHLENNDETNKAVISSTENTIETPSNSGGSERNVITINLRSQNNDWREAMEEDDNDNDDTTDSEDDEYTNRMFQSGRVVVSHLPNTVNVTRVPASIDLVQKRREELARRREEVRNMDRSQLERPKTSGKRKFEERMTLQEATAATRKVYH